MERIVIIGAGGHGRETLDIIEALNEVEPRYDVLGWIVESRFGTAGDVVNEKPILGDFDWFRGREHDVRTICAVGYPETRLRLADRARAVGARFLNLVHPSAILTRRISFGEGVIVAAGCSFTNQIRIGNHVHINRATTVGHDVVLDDFATLGPGVNVSGTVVLGEGCLVGTGASIVEKKRIGAWSRVGAGAVVIEDVPANSTVVGVPARVVRTRQPGWQQIKATVGA